MSSERGKFLLDNIDWLALVVVVIAYFAQAQGWVVIDAETVAAAASLGIVLRGMAERRRRASSKGDGGGMAAAASLLLVSVLLSGCSFLQAQQQKSMFERIADCVPHVQSTPELAVCMGVPPDLAGFDERARPCVSALHSAKEDPWSAIGECGPLVELALEAAQIQ